MGTPIFYTSDGHTQGSLMQTYRRVGLGVPRPLGLPPYYDGVCIVDTKSCPDAKGECYLLVDKVGPLEIVFLPGLQPPKFKTVEELQRSLRI